MNLESCKLFLESDRKTDAIKAKFQQERWRLRAKLALSHAAKTPLMDSSRTRTPSGLSQRQLEFWNAWPLIFPGGHVLKVKLQRSLCTRARERADEARNYAQLKCAMHFSWITSSVLTTVTIFQSQRANISIIPRPDSIFLNGAILLKVPSAQKPLQPT